MEATGPAPAAPTQPAGRFTGRVRWAIGLVVVVIAAPLLWLAATHPLASPSAQPLASTGAAAKGVGPQVGYEAPNFKLKDPSGKEIELKQLRGKPVLLNFWATWCEPCRAEMPELEQLYRDYRDKGLVVLGVSVDDPSAAKDIPAFLKEGNPAVGSYTFPVLLDQKQEVQKQYKLFGVPSSFFVDPSGVIRSVQPRVMSRQTMRDALPGILPGAQ